jgi:hypothetical protein
MRTGFFIILIQILLVSHYGCDRKDLDSLSTPDYQVFTLNTKGDTTITGKKGTKIVIPRNSFIRRDSTPVHEVEFCVEEYYEISEMVLKGLVTLSNNRVLETGGMIHIKATSEGGPVYLSKGSYLDVYFKKSDSGRLFMPFQGILDNKKEINWIESDSIELTGHKDIQIIKLGPFEDGLIVNINPAKSFFRSRVMGWINADIFLDYLGNRTLLVKAPGNLIERPQLIFKEINAILPGEKVDSDFYKFVIPDSLSWSIFVHHINNNRIYYDWIEKRDNIGDTIEVKLKPSSVQQLREKIDLWFSK